MPSSARPPLSACRRWKPGEVRRLAARAPLDVATQARTLLGGDRSSAEHRVDGGAHFPHDVEAGKRLAGMIYQTIRTNTDYQVAFEDARAEISRNAIRIIPAHIKHAPMPQLAH